MPKALAADNAVDPFQPIATDAPPSQITSRDDHPVPRLNIVRFPNLGRLSRIGSNLGQAPQHKPLSTNKFYANLFLGGQSNSVFTHPYSLSWSKGGGVTGSFGMAVSHIDNDQKAFGEPRRDIPGSPASFFINPLGIQSLVVSAMELGNSTTLTSDSLQAFSVNANLLPNKGASSSIKFPMVQGMGFVTGIYTNLQPIIQSGILFRTVVAAGSPSAGIFKYQITLEDGKSWLMYAMPGDGSDPNFSLDSNTLLRGPSGWSGTLQFAKNPSGANGEAVLDAVSGVYAISTHISGSVSGNQSTYSLTWTKAGLSTGQPLLMFALPHHLSSFADDTASAATKIQLSTTTKGMATGVVGDRWNLVESSLPADMGFAPWTPGARAQTTISEQGRAAIMAAAQTEIQEDMVRALSILASRSMDIDTITAGGTIKLGQHVLLGESFEQVRVHHLGSS